jgi:anti-sigma B factor antagonist
MEFSFEIHHFSEASVVDLRGKIMTDIEIEDVNKKILELIISKKCQLIFNLSDLKYINSTGINLFMKSLTKARTNNGDLIFFGVNGHVDNLFKISKLNEIYTIYSSLEEALNHFKNKI